MWLKTIRLVCACLLFICSTNLYALNIEMIDVADKDKYQTLINEPDNVRMIFVGDVMLSRRVKDTVDINANGDYRFIFEEIAGFMQGADIVFGNLENPVSDLKVKGNIPKLGPNFRSDLNFISIPIGCCNFLTDLAAIEGLLYAGFNVLSVANNHLGDKGREIMEDTFLNLNNANIRYVGGGYTDHEAHSPVIFDIKGIKIGFLAYTNVNNGKDWSSSDTQSGLAYFEKDKVRRDIEVSRNKVDVLIISLHTGDEGDWSVDSGQIENARFIIDAGSDLIIGHHSHNIQSMEVYRGGFIAYNLGNFVFDTNSDPHSTGLLLEMFLDKDLQLKIIPRYVRINASHQPVVIFD